MCEPWRCNTALDNGNFISRTEGLLLKTMIIVHNGIFKILSHNGNVVRLELFVVDLELKSSG